MKRIVFLILLFIFFVQALCSSVFAEIEPIKVMGLNYDDSSSLIYISTRDNFQNLRPSEPLRYIRLESPNRISNTENFLKGLMKC